MVHSSWSATPMIFRLEREMAVMVVLLEDLNVPDPSCMVGVSDAPWYRLSKCDSCEYRR